MRRVTSGYRMASHSTVIVFVVLSIIGLMLAGCGSSSWTSITAKRLNSSVGSIIGSLAFDSGHDTLYAAISDRGVWRCTNPDTSPAWQRMLGGVSLDYVYCLAYDPNHDVLYAGAGSGVFSYADPRSSSVWKSASGVGLNYSLAYDAIDNVLYAGTNAGVYRCINPASSPAWENTGGGVDGSTIYSLTFEPAHHILYAGTDTQGIGVWKYQSGTWTNSDTNAGTSKSIGSTRSLAYDSAHDILYAATGRGILRCAKPETAASWARAGGEVSSYSFSSIAYDQAHNILYAGAFVRLLTDGLMGSATKADTHSHGVWACSSPDTKPVWTNTGGEVSSEDIRDLVYDPVRGVLYAATERGAWRYTTKANQ